MKYKNGREAQVGDKVLLATAYGGPPVVGVLYDATTQGDFSNARIAPISQSDQLANVADCLHFDDVMAALKSAEKAA